MGDGGGDEGVEEGEGVLREEEAGCQAEGGVEVWAEGAEGPEKGMDGAAEVVAKVQRLHARCDKIVWTGHYRLLELLLVERAHEAVILMPWLWWLYWRGWVASVASIVAVLVETLSLYWSKVCEVMTNSISLTQDVVQSWWAAECGLGHGRK